MPFKITIEETKTVTKKVGKEWAKIGQIERQSNFNAKEIYLSDEMGYTPEIEKPVEVNVKTFEQTVEEMDLAAVIKAVNKLP